MDRLLAARAQMALSLMFHIIFAAIGIGLPLLLVLVEGLYLRTRKPHYLQLAHRWAKATGLLFGVGAVSGTALSVEIGLLWPKYIRILGPAVGHAFALEGYAFFIEAIFIGLYLYGWSRIGPRAHWWCGVCIALSGLASGVFVLAVNTWMQIPVGFQLDAAGNVINTDPLAIFRQYGWFAMSLHSTLACYVAVSFAVAAIYARSLLRGRNDAYTRSALRVCLAVGAIGAIVQPVSGDLLAKFVHRTQNSKFAAMEGQFRTERRAPARIGGFPDPAAHRTRGAIEIPGLLSFLAAGNTNELIVGLDDIPRDEWPNVELTHLSFQLMVACGMLLVLLSLTFWLIYWRRRDRIVDARKLLWFVVACGPLGFIALETGWMVTELGRQPWIIQHVMRTTDAVTDAASTPFFFFAFVCLYLVLGVVVVTLLRKLSDHQPPSSFHPMQD